MISNNYAEKCFSQRANLKDLAKSKSKVLAKSESKDLMHLDGTSIFIDSIDPSNNILKGYIFFITPQNSLKACTSQKLHIAPNTSMTPQSLLISRNNMLKGSIYSLTP